MSLAGESSEHKEHDRKVLLSHTYPMDPRGVRHTELTSDEYLQHHSTLVLHASFSYLI